MRGSFFDHCLNIFIGTFTCVGAYFAACIAFFTPDPLFLPFDLLFAFKGVFSLFIIISLSFVLDSFVLALPWSGKLLYSPKYPLPNRFRLLHLLATLFRDGFCILGLVAMAGVFLSLLFLPLESGSLAPLEYVRNTALAVFLAGWLGSLVPAALRPISGSKKTLPLLGCLLVCLMAGCSSKGLGGSFVGNLPTDGAIEAIAEDAASQLAELYPPGHTSLFVLTPEKDANNEFSVAFENTLRRKGFTVFPQPEENAVAVAYILDQLAGQGEKNRERVWYLQLRVSDNEEGGIAFARSYTATGRMEAGRSRTEIAFSRSAASRMADKATRKAEKAYDQAVEYLTE